MGAQNGGLQFLWTESISYLSFLSGRNHRLYFGVDWISGADGIKELDLEVFLIDSLVRFSASINLKMKKKTNFSR